jgi:Uma2 family endonuclease
MRKRRSPPLLESGDHLTAAEFLRRFTAMPDLKKAELVNGIVIMASPVRIDQHGEPDHLAQGWLFNYSLQTPGTRGAANSTTRLGPDDVPQPDALLRILPGHGGKARIDSKGYLSGAPELVFEVAASSASIDTREKRDAYRRAGVKEYIVWRTEDAELDWWQMVDDDYIPLLPDEDGIIRSRCFPGLWLEVEAMLREDAQRVIATLQTGLASAEHEAFVTHLQASVTPESSE